MTLDPTSAVPLWAQLRDALRQRLAAGEWPPGAIIPREVDLCEAYGVSRITAARAVQELVREGLLLRQRGRGTIVAPRRRHASAPPALAFVTPRFDTDWTLEKYSGFEAVVAAARHFALLTSTGGERMLSAHRIEALLAAHARGLALSHVRLDAAARALVPALRKEGVPLAFVGTYDPEVDCDRVVADNPDAGRIATEHLLRLGHRRIAFLAPETAAVAQSTSFSGRLAGYREAMRAAGTASEDLELLDALPEETDDQARVEHLLAFLDRTGATAAVTSTDALAILVMRYLRAAGLDVPEHLALVGISDTRFAAVVEVPLTTVRLDARAMGEEVARVLLRRLEGNASPPREVVLPVALVVRASCGARTGVQAPDPYQPAHAAQDAAVALQAALER
ncbi:MAG: GntR family transcriptional regulator [Chloroflexi bacterium]|nr:GntR family transcriptional regulator [Chloroflexota bacterium]